MRLLLPRVIPVVAYMAAIFALSSVPAREVASWGLAAYLLNIGHVPLFAGLAFLTLRALAGPSVAAAIAGATLCLLFAVSDEWHQTRVRGRVASLEDVRADALGIGIGAGIALVRRPAALARTGGSS